MKRIILIFAAIAIICSAFTGYVSADPVLNAKFKDVKDSDWFSDAVGKLNSLKIIDGLPDGSFNPKGEVTRAQFVKMLVQAMEYKKIDSVSFDDIKPFPSSKAHWASVYIETALRNGVIIKEEIGNNFYPDVPIARKDMAMMMFKALKLTPSEGANPFYDLTEANGYLTKLYEEYLIRGVIEGGKRLFRPEGLTTRAEAAVIISRMVDYKADPEGFKERMAMEERFANGTQTAEDIALKRQMEIEKAKADPNYIMEPMIRVLNTLDDYKGFGDMASTAYMNFAACIVLDNYEDYDNYSSNVQFKVVCINKDKDLINTGTLLREPFISYDHVYEVRRDVWKPLGGNIAYNKELKSYRIFSVTRDEEKSVNGKWVKVTDYVKKGEIINLKLYLKRGNNTQEYEINFKVN